MEKGTDFGIREVVIYMRLCSVLGGLNLYGIQSLQGLGEPPPVTQSPLIPANLSPEIPADHMCIRLIPATQQ